MIKLLSFCRRRPELTQEGYVEALLGRHVPLALAHHPAVRRYVVNLVEEMPPTEEPLDSISELVFDRLEDLRERLYDSPAGQAAVEHDARSLIGNAHVYVTTEHVQKSTGAAPPLGTRSPGIKLICPIMRRADMSHDEFVDHWLNRHMPLALQHHKGVSRYVTNVVDARLSETGEAWDGIAELHFASPHDLWWGMFDSLEAERLVQEDMNRFVGRGDTYRVAEYGQK